MASASAPDPFPRTAAKIHERFEAIFDTVAWCAHAHVAGRLDSYVDESSFIWQMRAQTRIECDPPHRVKCWIKYLGYDWNVSCTAIVERDFGQEPNPEHEGEEKKQEVEAAANEEEEEDKSTVQYCKQLNASMQKLSLSIHRRSWKFTKPLILRQKGVQIITFTFNDSCLLGHLVALGQYLHWAESNALPTPEGLVGDEPSVELWREQFTSQEAFAG